MSDGAIHAMGNGRLCAYGQGPDLIQVFGPPYGSPAFYRLDLQMDGSISVQSWRELGTAIWHHRLFLQGDEIGEFIDFIDSQLPCFLRVVNSSAPLHLALKIQAPASALVCNQEAVPHQADGGILLEAPAGMYIFHIYPFPLPIYHQMAWKGQVEVLPGEGVGSYLLRIFPGRVVLAIGSGEGYPDGIENTEAVLRTPAEDLLVRTRQWWQSFTSRRPDHAAQLPENLPERDRLLQAIDDTAVLIKAQQSAEGGVLAGHNYHLSYVRDQYGSARGLLVMGHDEEARRILEFYWGIWQHNGRIQNAQAPGVEGVFHIHENDRSEITGYLVQQAFDLIEKTGDEDILQQIFPMLDWAFQAQKSQLVDGMLPFNGDETYIAGGILPRSAINDGSAEATMLFIDGGEKLLAWAERKGGWTKDEIEENRKAVNSARSQYHKNFWEAGRLQTNNPGRLVEAVLPRFRHGVCERCVEEGTMQGIEWTMRSSSGRYLCPRCLAKGPYQPVQPRIYELLSVSLTPVYFRSSLFDLEELEPLVRSIADLYEKTGRLPSRPDDPHGITVGYDYGLLLFALTSIGDPRAEELYRKTLSLADSAGAWVEYYVNHQPTGTRCRPWESAINIEALLEWVKAR